MYYKIKIILKIILIEDTHFYIYYINIYIEYIKCIVIKISL